MNTLEILNQLGDMWVHVGSARDNGEAVDYAYLQKTLLDVKTKLEKKYSFYHNVNTTDSDGNEVSEGGVPADLIMETAKNLFAEYGNEVILETSIEVDGDIFYGKDDRLVEETFVLIPGSSD